LRRHERAHERRDEGGIQRDVEPGPRRASEHRKVPERRQLGRTRTEEVQEGGERRPDAEAERAAHASEAQHLDETRPEERLLERDALAPPRAHVPGAAEARGEAHEEHPAQHEQAELDGVEEIRGDRQADALEDVVLAAGPYQLAEALPPRFDRSGGRSSAPRVHALTAACARHSAEPATLEKGARVTSSYEPTSGPRVDGVHEISSTRASPRR